MIWGAGPLVRKIPGRRGELAGCLSCLSASLPPSPAPRCLPPPGVLLVLLGAPVTPASLLSLDPLTSALALAPSPPLFFSHLSAPGEAATQPHSE